MALGMMAGTFTDSSQHQNIAPAPSCISYLVRTWFSSYLSQDGPYVVVTAKAMLICYTTFATHLSLVD